MLGVTYKADVADARESPALDLIHLLREKGVDVAYHDPYLPSIDVEDVHMESISLTDEAIQSADCVVITTGHSWYDWPRVVDNAALIVDTRNATRGVASRSSRVVVL
jgi:UDP-N-acetyl-D-glucosamine dehydrogenase